MKKQAEELKKGDKIKIAGKIFAVLSTELSEIGKQGKRKVRIEAATDSGERLVIIRPEDYPFEVE